MLQNFFSVLFALNPFFLLSRAQVSSFDMRYMTLPIAVYFC